MRRRFMVAGICAAVASLAGYTGGAAAAATDQDTSIRPMIYCSTGTESPDVSRMTALSRADVWVHANIGYSQSLCHDNGILGNYRQDCSGFVSMAWDLATSYTTYQLDPSNSAFVGLTHGISWGSLRPGDALVLDNASTDHIGLFVGWLNSAHTAFRIAAETQPGEGTVSKVADKNGSSGEVGLWNYWRNFHPIRYDHIQDTPSGWAAYANGTRRMLRTGGSAGKVYQSTSPLGSSSWTAWSSFGVGSTPFQGNPGLIATRTRDDVFAVDTDGHVWHRIYHSGSGWGVWGHVRTTTGDMVTAMPGTGISALSGMGDQRLFTVSPSGKLYQTYYSGGWHSQSLGDAGGGFVGTPAAITAGGRLDVFATDADGYVYHRIYHSGGSWNSWGRVKTTGGSYVRAKPGTGVAAIAGQGDQRLFTVSPGGHVYQAYYSGGWHSQEIGTSSEFAGVPAVVVSADRMDVYAFSTGDNVYHRTYRLHSGWGDWSRIAGQP